MIVGVDIGGTNLRAGLVENGKVTHLAVEPAGGIDVSAAEKILEQL